jgi:hypothetical protein
MLRGLAAEKQIRISLEISPAIAVVNIDPAKFKQALYNYLSNAIKFTPEKGTVIVRIRPEGDDRFRLEVEDTVSESHPRTSTAFSSHSSSWTPTQPRSTRAPDSASRSPSASSKLRAAAFRYKASWEKGSIFVAVLPRAMLGSEEHWRRCPPTSSPPGASQYC